MDYTVEYAGRGAKRPFLCSNGVCGLIEFDGCNILCYSKNDVGQEIVLGAWVEDDNKSRKTRYYNLYLDIYGKNKNKKSFDNRFNQQTGKDFSSSYKTICALFDVLMGELVKFHKELSWYYNAIVAISATNSRRLNAYEWFVRRHNYIPNRTMFRGKRRIMFPIYTVNND